ncbi:GNAT family N-acetyltransferase [Schauerella aestuarii]|uniref:GNAT family N-acetyltransferase n=1 Tax=Schauerella aestuarii TaxID=2511204 RepID=UPI00136F69A5|nr:GNAT family N-acetyltransferase [Achromobacter aestuarii]MYZ41882.1 GNAT family N-acetyltransferase [Achromobacter aestuarii]
MAGQITLVVGDWVTLAQDALNVRHDVFVAEQGVPLELERDDMDPVSIHAVAYGADGAPAGTGRLLPDGHIGRMAVHRHARGTGVGRQLLEALMTRGIADGHKRFVLSAQTHAQGFYARSGFTAHGEITMDAGIPHIEMVRDI